MYVQGDPRTSLFQPVVAQQLVLRVMDVAPQRLAASHRALNAKHREEPQYLRVMCSGTAWSPLCPGYHPSKHLALVDGGEALVELSGGLEMWLRPRGMDSDFFCPAYAF
jgi:hypothetical protein